jgi:UDP-GlcNAc:undecaprenyl-phosphate/decaprenyl-phosphate GlcNAc-1-phosphate transferase
MSQGDSPVVHLIVSALGGPGRPPSLVVYAVAFMLAAVSSLVFTFFVRNRARRANLFDRFDARKVHENDVPRVGGVGIVLAVGFTCVTTLILFGPRAMTTNTRGLLVVFAGGLAIHLVGLYDDIRQLHARWKFLAQVVVAVLVFAAGVRMTTLSLPFVRVVNLGFWAGLVFTVIWFVGITNAFNLIDGLDGLAAGAALFALTTMFVVAIANARYGAALATLTLAGATLGFLYYNFYPATIFLGDSGSLFLGFMLAGIGVLSAQKSPTVVAVAIPVVSLGLPVLDTLIAVTRRFLRRQPIFTADRGHIHHRLLGRGYSPRAVVLALYGVCAVLALAAMLLVNDGGPVPLVLVTVGIGVGFLVQRLRIYEFEEAARLLRRGVQQRRTIERGVRVREASARLSEMGDLAAVFESLAEIFAADGCPRAEVRLTMAFLDARRERVAPGPSAGGIDDTGVAVWTWRAADPSALDARWWHVTLPLFDERGDRMGSFVIWQQPETIDSPLPHFHAIAGELRRQVEDRLLSLWPVGDPLRGAVAGFFPHGGTERAASARRRGRDRVPSGSGPAVPAA